jgi:predicted transcriptional regulator
MGARFAMAAVAIAHSLPTGSLLLALLGLARHASTRRENLPRHPLRSAILAAVAETSGLLLSDLRRRIGCSAGTIQHHLRHLERGGFVAEVRLHRRRWIFPAGLRPDTCLGLAVLRSGRARDFAQSLARAPGQVQGDLARSLAASRRAVRGHLARLVQSGLAVAVPRGRAVAYHPTDRLLGLLAIQRFGPSPAPEPAPSAAPSGPAAPLVLADVPQPM